MVDAQLISEIGAAGVVLGAMLAFKSETESKNQKVLQTAAGTLLVAGFACLGAAFSMHFGVPRP